MCLYLYLLFDTRMCFRSVRQTQLANSIAALLLSSFRLRPQLFLPQTYNQQKNKSDGTSKIVKMRVYFWVTSNIVKPEETHP